MKKLFLAALLLAVVLLMPLGVVLSSVEGPLTARATEGTIWRGRLVDASLSGQPLGDLDARLSPLSLLTGKARVRLDGERLHGAVIASPRGSGAEIAALDLALPQPLGPLTLSGLDIADARIRLSGERCAEAEGRIAIRLRSPLGEQRLSGAFRCSGAALAADLVSQSAMERLSLRFPDPGHYQATLIVRASDTGQASGLAASGFRETAAGHVLRFSGAF